ncbi:MAG: AmmeMemoRadiSam system protein B [Tepidisphaeraceae bacterium]
MSGPRDQSVRSPAVAGMFYPAGAAPCRHAARELLASARPALSQMSSQLGSEPGIGAVVPHAGWICSGAVAAEAILSLARQRPAVDLVVVFGAIHTPIPIDRGVLDSHARWAVPGGESSVTALREELSADTAQFVTDDRFHLREHAVEVELPLIQATWPAAQILPIEVPPDESAVELGRSVARAVAAVGLSAVYLASSDLTHYGSNYRFAPAGVGAAAMQWAMENDRRVLRIITDMTPEKIVPEARTRNNACGAGAIAAMMSACLEQGARKAVVLRHTSSYQTLAAVAPQTPDNAVGYAAVWVG